MENNFKAFHFQEVDWLIYFPLCGNSGKYRIYNVVVVERKEGNQLETKLGDVLDRPEIDEHYPHTVGYFKSSSASGINSKPEYLELRGIGTVEEFWMFLNSVNL